MIIFKAFAVTDMNEVTSHGYEVILSRMKLKQLKQIEVSSLSYIIVEGLSTFSVL